MNYLIKKNPTFAESSFSNNIHLEAANKIYINISLFNLMVNDFVSEYTQPSS